MKLSDLKVGERLDWQSSPCVLSRILGSDANYYCELVYLGLHTDPPKNMPSYYSWKKEYPKHCFGLKFCSSYNHGYDGMFFMGSSLTETPTLFDIFRSAELNISYLEDNPDLSDTIPKPITIDKVQEFAEYMALEQEFVILVKEKVIEVIENAMDDEQNLIYPNGVPSAYFNDRYDREDFENSFPDIQIQEDLGEHEND